MTHPQSRRGSAELPELQRSVERWSKSDPAAMASQSEAAIYFAFQDAIADIRKLANALADERRKARAELIAEMVPVAVRAQGGTLYPTACQDAAIIRSRGSEPLAIIPKE